VKGLLHLASAHARHHRWRSLLLTFCLTVAFLLPATTRQLMARYEQDLTARAEATPLVAGTRGNRFDLTLGALYFRQSALEPVHMGLLEEIQKSGRGVAVPLHTGHLAREATLVGTSLEYYEQRGLKPAAGSLPLMIGDALLGSEVAARLGLEPGDSINSDPTHLYDISQPGATRLSVCGVLAPTATPDDDAVFVDIKTAWMVSGLVHGHGDVTSPGALEENMILSRSENSLSVSPALIEYDQVSEENIWDFHLHASPDQLPLTAILFFPADAKDATILKAEFNRSPVYQMVVPRKVVDELLNYAFKIKRLLDGVALVLFISTLVFGGLVLSLTARLRREEFDMLHAIGCSRSATWKLVALELAGIVSLAAAGAGAGLALLITFAPDLVRVF
jgi:putative ABC transport system permease protein